MRRVPLAVILALSLVLLTAARLPRCRPDQPVGGGPGSAATPTPSTGFWRSLTGEYSYNANATVCSPAYDLEHAVDPITVIARLHYHAFLPDVYAMVGSLDWEHAQNHVDHHGWSDGANGGQFFRQDNECRSQSITLARHETYSFEQFHVRGYKHFGVQDPYHYGATVTPMTPHFDESTQDLFPPYSACNLVDHYVEEDYDPDPDQVWSGFDRGREELVVDWLDDADHHHRMVESQFWGRPVPQQQCNGDLTSANGYVYHIGLCEQGYPC